MVEGPIDGDRPHDRARAFVLASLTLIVAGPAVAERLAASFGLGAAFEWTWMVLQWPLAFAFVSTALGLVYYFGPDADQDWAWITPGAVVATALWVVVSLALKVYVANFADYNAMYGAVGAVIICSCGFTSRAHSRWRRAQRGDRACVAAREEPARKSPARGKK